jgi:hypothetical protein
MTMQKNERCKRKNALRSLIVLSIFSLGVLRLAPAQSSLTVCDLLKSSKRYDHKTLSVTGYIFADIHSTGIEGTGCSRGVVIRYDPDSTPADFVNSVEAKRTRVDTRQLKVTVEGKFFAHVKGSLGLIYRLEVTKIINSQFVQDTDDR